MSHEKDLRAALLERAAFRAQAQERKRKRALALHEAGWSTLAISQEVHADPGTVKRRLSEANAARDATSIRPAR